MLSLQKSRELDEATSKTALFLFLLRPSDFGVVGLHIGRHTQVSADGSSREMHPRQWFQILLRSGSGKRATMVAQPEARTKHTTMGGWGLC